MIRDTDIINEFTAHLTEFEGGLTNLKYRLGDSYQDVKQEAIISLIKYNTKYGINKEKMKGFMFITLKNKMIQYLDKLDRYKYTTVNIGDYGFGISNQEDEYEEDKEDMINLYSEQLLSIVTKEEYDLLINYFDNRYSRDKGGYNRKLANRIGNIKSRIGYSKYYEISGEDGIKHTYNTLKEISEHIGVNNSYLSDRLDNDFIKYKGEKYKIKMKCNIKKLNII